MEIEQASHCLLAEVISLLYEKKFTRSLILRTRVPKFMKHFLNLDRCTCGAYRYLAVREHKRSFEVYLIHHSHSLRENDSRKYRKLASVPKYKLNIHDERINEMKDDCLVRLSFEQVLALKSLARELSLPTDEPTKMETESGDESLEPEQLVQA
jgi:hypothetical protein